MVSAMLEDVSLQPPSTTQRWRQLYLLLTMDISNTTQLLSLAAEILLTSSGASACVIDYHAPHSEPLRVTCGELTPTIEQAIKQAASHAAERQFQPLIELFADATTISLPINVDGATVGLLHLSHPATDIPVDEIQVIAVMLANALARQSAAERAKLCSIRVFERYQAVQNVLTRVLTESASLADATPLLLQSFCESLGWELGVYWSIDAPMNRLGHHVVWQESAIRLAKEQPSELQQTLAEYVRVHAEPRWIADTMRCSDWEQDSHPTAQTVRAAFCFPVMSGNVMRGVIGLFSGHVRQPDPVLINMLTTFGSQIGQFIDTKVAEHALRQREHKYRLVVDQVHEVIFETDVAGRWSFLNQAWTDITGFGVEESLGQYFWSFIHPDDQEHNAALLLPLLEGKTQRCRYETRYLTRAGDVRWIEVQVWLTVDAEGQHTGTAGMLNDVTDRKATETVNAELTEALRIERDRLLRREIEVRTQIGRDLHDGPVQQVAVADLTVQYVRRMAEREPERLGEALDDLRAQLQRATRDLRTVLYELRPLGIAEEGLVMVLHQYVARIDDHNGLCIHLNASDNLPRIAPDYEAAVFIIVQEAINNVRKHAKARNIWITLGANAADLFAEVRDDGCGFPVEQIQANYIQRGSFGLLNMAERAQLLNGSCVVTSAPGAGTSVTVRVPLIV
jgi:PAS domain S-box-containing protein